MTKAKAKQRSAEREARWKMKLDFLSDEYTIFAPEKFLGKRTCFFISRYIVESGRQDEFDWYFTNDGGINIRKAQPYGQANK